MDSSVIINSIEAGLACLSTPVGICSRTREVGPQFTVGVTVVNNTVPNRQCSKPIISFIVGIW